MKQRNLMKKVGVLLLTAVMLVSVFPQLSKKVHAAELPDITQFATADELKTFNTNDQDGDVKAAKVYFGNNNHEWWIAGSQNGNLTLFAASLLSIAQPFEPNININKKYSADWNCVYEVVPNEVNPNHYGASPLRNELQNLETSYFTSEEQKLMNATRIYTHDRNNNSIYFTEDKLYLAYGDDIKQCITVGANANTVDSLNNGLNVDKNYWVNRFFWLRSPRSDHGNYTMCVKEGSVSNDTSSQNRNIVPAFELNLSSVIFSSTVPVVTSDGKVSLNDTMTLRYRANGGNVGTATISLSKKYVTVTGVTNDNTYLVVQNSNGAWAKKVRNNDVLFAKEMIETLSSFDNCKVWLETTMNRITYANEAIEAIHANGYSVKINAGQNMTVTTGNEVQVGVTGAIKDIVVKTNDGYYLLDNYKDSVTLPRGLNITQNGNKEVTISGTPVSDELLLLPPATMFPKADTPKIEIKKTAKSITVDVTNHKNEFGDIQYKWDNNDWTINKTLSNLGANTSHTVSVRFAGKGLYQMSDEETITKITDRATYTITIPMSANADGKEIMIEVDDTEDFDLGYNGKVDVKIKTTSAVSNGSIRLRKANSTDVRTIASSIFVSGQEFKDFMQNVATFTNKTDKGVPVIFQKPLSSSIISAGTYKGTVVFNISYSE